MRATVVVLGDFGMSPRMQNHALALAAAGYKVNVVANIGCLFAFVIPCLLVR